MANENLERIHDAVTTSLIEEPTIRDATKIVVDVTTEGVLWSKKTVVRLSGSVSDKSEQSKAEELTKNRAPDAEIRNEISVQ